MQWEGLGLDLSNNKLVPILFREPVILLLGWVIHFPVFNAIFSVHWKPKKSFQYLCTNSTDTLGGGTMIFFRLLVSHEASVLMNLENCTAPISSWLVKKRFCKKIASLKVISNFEASVCRVLYQGNVATDSDGFRA